MAARSATLNTDVGSLILNLGSCHCQGDGSSVPHAALRTLPADPQSSTAQVDRQMDKARPRAFKTLMSLMVKANQALKPLQVYNPRPPARCKRFQEYLHHSKMTVQVSMSVRLLNKLDDNSAQLSHIFAVR